MDFAFVPYLVILFLVLFIAFKFLSSKKQKTSEAPSPDIEEPLPNSGNAFQAKETTTASFLVQETSEKPLEEAQIERLEGSLYEYPIQNYISGFSVEVIKSRELRQQPSPTESTLHFDLDVSKFAGKIFYHTACDIGLYPENDDQSVLEAASYLGLDLKSVVRLVPNPNAKNKSAKLPFPSPLTLGAILKKHIDLSGMIRKTSFRELASMTQDPAISKE